jgi:pentatricopeptide repeat protein
MPLGVVETQERLAWLLQLTLASKRHDAEHARALLAEMSDSGCQPGAREYHLAVVACGTLAC